MEHTMDFSAVQSTATRLKENMEKVIIGKDHVIELVLTSLFANGHILLEDVPGTGKTVLAKSLAKSLEADFKRIQFTPDLLPSDITGLNYYNQKEQEFSFRSGPVFANIILADEINRATPRTQSSLLECMEERQVTVDGETRTLKLPFFVIATQNPIETAGTFPLPEAQLDRFIMKLSVGIPDFNQEFQMLNRFLTNDPLIELTPVCNIEEVLQAQDMIRHVYIHPSLQEYLLQIVTGTRKLANLSMGVSPRGSLAFLRYAQAYAAIQGRPYVLPDDIKYLAPYVLSHRILMHTTYDTKTRPEDYITQIIDSLDVPTEDFRFHNE